MRTQFYREWFVFLLVGMLSCLPNPPVKKSDIRNNTDMITSEYFDTISESDFRVDGDYFGIADESDQVEKAIEEFDESFDGAATDLLPSEDVLSCFPTGDEECDGQDNDCDGLTDEDFDLEKDARHCGTCENDCWNLANVADVACANGFCVISLCRDGFVDIDQKTEDGCECEMTNGGVESCDQSDNDCNGQTDDGLPECCKPGEERDCGFKNLGECRLGKEKCLEGGSWSGECLGAVLPQDEICDNKDNDCNGTTDDEFDLGVLCEVGIGECKRAGEKICSQDGVVTVCDAVPGDPQEELCDGKDNDCDDATDEDWPALGAPCEHGQGECKAGGNLVCDLEGEDTICNAVPGEPQDESCDHKDNNCDGLTDEAFPELGTTCSVGTGECERDGVFVCNLETGLSGCSVEPGTPQEEVCDNKDNDCSGITDDVNPVNLQSDVNHCGKCFNTCPVYPNATGPACQNGKCIVPGCKSKWYDANKNPEDGCECAPSQGGVDICDGMDNDCDGEKDEYCNSLVLYLPLDEGSGTTVYDKSNFGNHGAKAGSENFGWTTDGVVGKAVTFANEGWIEIPNSGSLDIAYSITVMFWAKAFIALDCDDRDNYRWVITKGISWGCDSSWFVIFTENNAGCHVHTSHEGNCVGNAKNFSGAPVDLGPGKWSHFAFTFDANQGQIRQYFNGVLSAGSAIVKKPILSSTAPVRLGHHHAWSCSLEAPGLPGAMDEVVIYNKALSEDEIKHLYNLQKPN